MQNAGEIAAKMGAAQYAVPLALACAEFSIDSDMELAHFLGQLAVESGDFSRVIESLNYSVKGLLNTFGRHRISVDECGRYGRIKGRAANQQMIANTVYGGLWGRQNLGNIHVGDGWKFRGHGLGQHTGRANITIVSHGLFGDMRLTEDPDPLATPKVAARAAAYWWNFRRVKGAALRDDVIAVRKIWNGGLNGIDHATAATNHAKKIMGLV